MDRKLKLLDVATGNEVHSLQGHSATIRSFAFSQDGRLAASGDDGNTIKLWNVAKGEEIRTIAGRVSEVQSVGFSPDKRFVLSAGSDNTIRVWGASSGALIRTFADQAARQTFGFLADNRTVLSIGVDGSLNRLDVTTGDIVGTSRDGTGGKFRYVSSDGRWAMSWQDGGELKLWDTSAGSIVRTLPGHMYRPPVVAFALDAPLLLKTHPQTDSRLTLWNIADGREVRSFDTKTEILLAVAFSPDGRLALSAGCDTTNFKLCDPSALKLWDVATGTLLHACKGHARSVTSGAFSPDGKLAASGGADGTVRLWDVATGRHVRTLVGHTGRVEAIAFSFDGKQLVSGSDDGTMRIWTIATGKEVATVLASLGHEWLTIVPAGFFASSPGGGDGLTVVRGLDLTTLSQLHQSLYSPDLVGEALLGDPDGEFERAAQVVNLDKVIDSGPAPDVELTSQLSGSRSDTERVTIEAKIKNRGKGIGRIEWRVNGITVGTSQPGSKPGDRPVTQTVALERGDNLVEVVAYNARNLLAGLPAMTTIRYESTGEAVKPKLSILAIGINAYVDDGWSPLGEKDVVGFAPLNLAVDDAKFFAEEMRAAAAGLYSEVRVRTVLDGDATAAGLERAVAKAASEMTAADTFVLFAAAHGFSNSGRFYLIPQDYQGGTNPVALARKAVGQDVLQNWIANRVHARKVLVLLDTCESGALVSGHMRSRTDVPASEAAVGRLHEAIGRPVLTAAAAGQPAFEGYRGHGVFTWALIDALRNGDNNRNGLIELSELVAHVQYAVPRIAAELNGEARSAVAMRGRPVGSQFARFGSRGEDYPIARRLQ